MSLRRTHIDWQVSLPCHKGQEVLLAEGVAWRIMEEQALVWKDQAVLKGFKS